MKAPALILFLVACGGGEGDNNNTTDAAGPGADAPEMVMDAPPSNVPAMLMIKGKTSERGISGTTAVGSVAVAIYKVSDEATPLATTTSDAQGNYTMMVPTGGVPLDGYVKATKASYVDIYVYPPAAWIADDTDGSINMMSPGNRDLMLSLAGATQDNGKGMIGIAVFDSANMGVSGATFLATPAAGAVRYVNSSGLPSANATMTAMDGVGFLFNTSETVTVTANKAGMTFHAHTVKARAGAFTNTSVAP